MSKVRGAISVRRLLQRAPDAVRAEIASTLTQAAPVLEGAMVARAPRGKTGRLIAGLGWKFYPKTLRLVVGFIGVRLNRKLFYARIVEGGRRAQVVTVQRRKVGRSGLRHRRKKFEDIASTYQLRVKAREPHHFVYTPETNLRSFLATRLNGIWDRALRRIAETGDE